MVAGYKPNATLNGIEQNMVTRKPRSTRAATWACSLPTKREDARGRTAVPTDVAAICPGMLIRLAAILRALTLPGESREANNLPIAIMQGIRTIERVTGNRAFRNSRATREFQRPEHNRASVRKGFARIATHTSAPMAEPSGTHSILTKLNLTSSAAHAEPKGISGCRIAGVSRF